jgi:hypothetical protein
MFIFLKEDLQITGVFFGPSKYHFQAKMKVFAPIFSQIQPAERIDSSKGIGKRIYSCYMLENCFSC